MTVKKAFDYLSRVNKTIGDMTAQHIHAVGSFADNIRQAWVSEGRIWIVGNGGSATTASHFANDLVKMCGMDAISIPDLTSITLAYGNDTEYEFMFSNYLRTVAKRQDVLIAISCSGRSRNVLNAADVAYEKKMVVLALTGSNHPDNLLINPRNEKNVPDVYISIDASDIRVVEDVHLAVCHAIAGELMD